MLRFKPIENANDAEIYYSKSDGGYYLNAYDLRQEWGGLGAEKLGLHGSPEFEPFRRLIHGLHPETGESLTARLVDNRIPGWDVTAAVPKGVTTAVERGDERVREAIWRCGRLSMGDLERRATTRVRKGGVDEDRVTGNIIWYGTEHPETRPTKEDHMPDWDRHIHYVILNGTFDPVEQEWKALKFRPLMDMRKWFSHRFDMHLTAELVELGYEIETKWETDPKGGAKYSTWDIKGIPEAVIDRFSRRTHEIAETEAAIVAERKEAAKEAGHPDWEKLPDRLSKLERDKLGATSRLNKRDDLTIEDFREYWNGRITPEEGEAIAETIARARERAKEGISLPGLESQVAFAISHHYEYSSVVPTADLEISVMERSMGRGVPEQILPEFERQGGFTGMVGGVHLASTHEMQGIEDQVLSNVIRGRGTCRPLVPGEHHFMREFLNGEQRDAVNHILHSADRVIGIRGKSGTGKTSSLLEAAEAIEKGSGKSVFTLAPSTPSVAVLQEEGFGNAVTLARLLIDTKKQEAIQGGVVFLDEAGLVSMRGMNALLKLTEARGAKLVLLGDTFQHSPIGAGDSLRLLETSGGLKTAEITTIQRQKNTELKAAVAAFARHDVVSGMALLDAAGSIKEIETSKERYEALAEIYLDKLSENRSVGIVCPTHREGDEVTAVLREALRRDGRLGEEERTFETLVNYNLSEAMRAEPRNYQTSDIVVFHQNAKGFKRGERVEVVAAADDSGTVMVRKSGGELRALPLAHADRFQMFGASTLPLSIGDTIQFTRGGEAEGGKRITNGMTRKVAEFSKKGLVLDNGWVVKNDYSFIRHGYVKTSVAKQGRTEDFTLVAEDSATGRAASREQIYVSASRAKHQVLVFTDDKKALLESVKRSSVRMTATQFAGKLDAAPVLRQTRLREQAERIIRLGMIAKAHAAQILDDIRHEIGRMTHERFARRSQNAQDVSYER